MSESGWPVTRQSRLSAWWGRTVTRFTQLRAREGLNLLAPPLIAEIVIHLRQDGKRQMYVSKGDAEPRQIIDAVLSCVLELAQQHNVKITFGEGKK